ncbi:MAG: hypothetical protein KQI35_14380 [Bacteroidetes bacterium]|nr:hypothetical protein [Bacteroidota bacterium]
MGNIYDFIANIKTYLNKKFEDKYWIDPKHTSQGALLIRSLIDNKKIIFKPIDSTLPIGGKRIQDFIIKTPTFKRNAIDNYIIVARKFKENAIKLTKLNRQLTLLIVDFENKNILLYGSNNLDIETLKVIKTFSVHFDDLVKKTIRNKINKPKSVTIEAKKIDQNYWADYNQKYPSFKYVVIIAFIILFSYIISMFSSPDPERAEFIETRAKMMKLKEKGLVTDEDIKRYEDAYYESRKNKNK